MKNSGELVEFFISVSGQLQTNNRAELLYSISSGGSTHCNWSDTHHHTYIADISFADCKLACMIISNAKEERRRSDHCEG